MGDNLIKLCILNLIGDFFRRKCTLSRCAPDIDSPGIYHQNPAIIIPEFFAECVKAQFVVGSNQHRAVFGGLAGAVETGGDFIVVSGKAGSGANCTEMVAGRKRSGNSGYRANRCFYKTFNKRKDEVTGTFKSTGPWGKFRPSTVFV